MKPTKRAGSVKAVPENEQKRVKIALIDPADPKGSVLRVADEMEIAQQAADLAQLQAAQEHVNALDWGALPSGVKPCVQCEYTR
jgi:hypothetical protein